jgi:hypothetical protein
MTLTKVFKTDKLTHCLSCILVLGNFKTCFCQITNLEIFMLKNKMSKLPRL